MAFGKTSKKNNKCHTLKKLLFIIRYQTTVISPMSQWALLNQVNAIVKLPYTGCLRTYTGCLRTYTGCLRKIWNIGNIVSCILLHLHQNQKIFYYQMLEVDMQLRKSQACRLEETFNVMSPYLYCVHNKRLFEFFVRILNKKRR